MFRLTREVRFAVNGPGEAPPTVAKAPNSFAGFPSIAGLGQFLALQVTLGGELETSSQYLRNIKEIDEVVRNRGVDRVSNAVREGAPAGCAWSWR